MASRSTTRKAAADQAATTDTAGDDTSAPLEPPAELDEHAGEDGELSGPTPAQAAPLEPPATPVAPVASPGPSVDMRMIATPGAEFVDLVWSDGTPADPDELFVDPGAQFTYVVTARAIERRYFQPGARRTSGDLVFPEGWRVAREHADRMAADLRRLREEQAAAAED